MTVAVSLFSLLLVPVACWDYKEAAGKFKSAASQDHTVQDGSYHFFQLADCQTLLETASPFPTAFTSNGTCYVNNPSTPYGLVMLPKGAEEQDYGDWGFPIEENGMSATWRLQPSEAVVLMGLTPPTCTYFGFTNYLYSRFMPEGWKPDKSLSANAACEAGPKRCEIFASLADSANMHRMNISSSGNRFSTPFALVLSPSEAGASSAITNLLKSGVPAESITALPFPGQDLRLGVDKDADAFTNILRMAFFDDDNAAQAYFAEKPFSVFRVTMASSTGLYSKASFISRPSGKTDGSVLGYDLAKLDKGLDQLEKQIKKKYGSFFNLNSATSKFTSGVPNNGFGCIELGQKCQGDCPDTYYPASISMVKTELFCQKFPRLCRDVHRAYLSDDKDDFMIVIGANHKKTQMAGYSSLSIYDLYSLAGIHAVDDRDMLNTAEPFFSEPIPEYVPYLYAYKFMRRCPKDERGCYSVPADGNLSIGLKTPILFMERMYDNPDTHVGGDPASILTARVLHFSGGKDVLTKLIV